MPEITFAYPATFTADEDGRVLVRFPDLPDALTDGADMEEALTQASDCLGAAIAARLNEAEPIPPPSRRRPSGRRPSGRRPPGRGSSASSRIVVCPAEIAQKAALHLAMQGSGVRIVDLARTLDIDKTEVRRLLDPARTARPERIEAAIAACGMAMRVTLTDASPGGRVLRTPREPGRSIHAASAVAPRR